MTFISFNIECKRLNSKFEIDFLYCLVIVFFFLIHNLHFDYLFLIFSGKGPYSIVELETSRKIYFFFSCRYSH